MLAFNEKNLIQVRVQWLWNERNARLERFAQISSSGSPHLTDHNGNVIGFGQEPSPELFVSWFAWQIKQDFQKTTLRDVFMQAVADEFNNYMGIRASFMPNPNDDQRQVVIQTIPVEVEAPKMMSWPSSLQAP